MTATKGNKVVGEALCCPIPLLGHHRRFIGSWICYLKRHVSASKDKIRKFQSALLATLLVLVAKGASKETLGAE